MTYNPNIPTGPQFLSVSQPLIEANFQQLNTQFAIDHSPFNTGSGNGTGFHKRVTFGAVASDPNQSAPICSLYTKLVSGVPQLFFQNGSSSTNIVRLTSDGGFTAYTPTITGDTFTGLSITGNYAVIGGMTFFVISATWTGAGVGTSPTTVSLPSTCTSVGQANYSGNPTSSNAQIGTISSGNNYISFANLAISPTAPRSFLINGFYI